MQSNDPTEINAYADQIERDTRRRIAAEAEAAARAGHGIDACPYTGPARAVWAAARAAEVACLHLPVTQYAERQMSLRV